MAGESRPELVIVRRRNAFEDVAQKGGVWKIAYADFMTAMMAFFLVMWLINAVNKDGRESIANYFNPIKLAESTPERKGLDDPKGVDPGKQDQLDYNRPAAEPGKSPQADKGNPAKKPQADEASLFRDPYSVLTEIAGGPPDVQRYETRIGSAAGSAQDQTVKTDESYRDPYDPLYWSMSAKASVDNKVAKDTTRARPPADDSAEAANKNATWRPVAGQTDVTVVPPRGAPAEADPAMADTTPSAVAPAKPAARSQLTPPQAAASAQSGATAQPAAAKAEAGPSNPIAAQQAALAAPTNPSVDASADLLKAAVAAALAQDAGTGPGTEVQRTDEGLLISLTDSANFGMFAIGSAEPRAELIRLIDRFAPLLAKAAGAIVVRGHTDNRPFRSANYDNWRLSTARAQMAYHMLVRAGIDPQRIERIEGHADRSPKIPSDPAAPQNRRIEVLIREPKR